MSMTVTINKDRYNALRSAVAYKFCDTWVNVYENNSMFGEGTLKWTVSWSSIGDQPTSVAREFMEELQDAIRISDALNEMSLEVEYKADPELIELLEGDREEASRRWVKFKMDIAGALNDIIDEDPSSFEHLYELLTDHRI